MVKVEKLSEKVFTEIEDVIKELQANINLLRGRKRWNKAASRRLRLNIQRLSARRVYLKRALMEIDELSRKE